MQEFQTTRDNVERVRKQELRKQAAEQSAALKKSLTEMKKEEGQGKAAAGKLSLTSRRQSSGEVEQSTTGNENKSVRTPPSHLTSPHLNPFLQRCEWVGPPAGAPREHRRGDLVPQEESQ